MRAPSEPTSSVGKPMFNVPMRKLSFTCCPVLNIAAGGEEKVEIKRTLQQSDGCGVFVVIKKVNLQSADICHFHMFFPPCTTMYPPPCFLTFASWSNPRTRRTCSNIVIGFCPPVLLKSFTQKRRLKVLGQSEWVRITVKQIGLTTKTQIEAKQRCKKWVQVMRWQNMTFYTDNIMKYAISPFLRF